MIRSALLTALFALTLTACGEKPAEEMSQETPAVTEEMVEAVEATAEEVETAAEEMTEETPAAE